MSNLLREKLIRLAAANPEVRAQILPLLEETRTAGGAAAVLSVSEGIEQGCLALAQALQRYLVREYAQEMTFSEPTIHGVLTAGFEAKILNQLSPQETGYLGINFSYFNKDLRLEVFGDYPRGATISKRFPIDPDTVSGQVATKYGAALVKNWIDPFLMEADKKWNSA